MLLSTFSARSVFGFSRDPSNEPCPQPQYPAGHGASMTESDDSGTKAQAETLECPSSRFILRTCLLVIVPPVITVYFGIICWVYQLPDPDKMPYGHRNAQWVFYSWFIISVFGLGISRYGLAGIEAAMVEDSYWHAPDGIALFMHSRQSWSGPGGWLKYLQIIIAKRKSPVHRLWWLLGLLSLMIIIALPLSGLSMELFDGFVKASGPPPVKGYNPESFNKRRDSKALERSVSRWRASSPVNLPGAGIAYTPRGLDRNDYDYLTDLPNSLSTAQDVPDLFLIPQAQYPVSGRPWGMRLSYNCSVVESESELTILPKKKSLPSDFITLANYHGLGSFGLTAAGSSDSIYAYNSSADNLFMYAELGTILNTSYEYESGNSNPDILEYVMWQTHSELFAIPSGTTPYDFDNTIAMPIADIGSPLVMDGNGTVVPNETFFGPESGRGILRELVAGERTGLWEDTHFLQTAQPIGVRCQARSEMGNATLHPEELTFSNFTRVPPELPPSQQSTGDGEGFVVTPALGMSTWYQLSDPETAFKNLLESTENPISIRVVVDPVYPSYVQAADLQQSLMRAYAQSAFDIMYYGFDTFSPSNIANNITASHPGKVLGPGVLPPHIPLVMLVIWATGCVILGLVYGFRRRRAETLDGYVFFKLGANYAKSMGDVPVAVGPHHRFYKNEGVWRLPELGRDMLRSRRTGHATRLGEGRSYTRSKSAFEGLPYRHTYTAQSSGNEEENGQRIRDSGIPREDIWVTTKLDNTGHTGVEEAVASSLDRLGVLYLDLFLMVSLAYVSPSRRPSERNSELEFYENVAGNAEYPQKPCSKYRSVQFRHQPSPEYGFANAVGLVLLILTRAYLVQMSRKAIDRAMEGADSLPVTYFGALKAWERKLQSNPDAAGVKPERNSRDDVIPEHLLRPTFVTDTTPCSPVRYRLVQWTVWVAFLVHIVTLGMAKLATQIYIIALMTISTVLICSGCDCDDSRVYKWWHMWRHGEKSAGCTQPYVYWAGLNPTATRSKARMNLYAWLNLSDEEQGGLCEWHLLPHKRSHDDSWWNDYEAKQALIRDDP
ncbi:hypothetical protein BJX99DRAFT_253999 [Aspergillus californicus]